MLTPTNKYVFVNGVNLHYAEWEGEGEAILLVHGLTANARMFDLWASYLAPKYRLISPDLRGRGESDKPPATNYGISVHADDMNAMLDALALDKVNYIGASLGAGIGLDLASRYPGRVKKLILGDAGGLSDTFQATLDSLQMTIARVGKEFPSLEAYMESWRNNPLFNQIWSQYLEIYLEADVEVRPDGTAKSKVSKAAIEEDLRSVVNMDYEAVYPKVSCPTLLLRAPCGIVTDTDYILSPEVTQKIVKSIPNCQLHEEAGANHYTIFLQDRPSLMQVMLDFITS